MNRNKLLWCLSVVLLTQCVSAQKEKTHSNEGSLYSKALFASLAEMDKSWGHVNDNNRNSLRSDYRHTFVEADPSITDDLPSQSGEYHIEYLNDKAQIARYQKLKQEFPLLKVFPLVNDGPKLKIGINVYYFSYKKQHMMYGLSDWSSVEFRFDCDKQEFVISSVKLGGI